MSSCRHRRPNSLTLWIALLWLVWTPVVHGTSADELAFFESRIRPLLAEQCYSCHSAKAEKLKGGLHVDSREGLLRGGELGPALVPGDAGKSLLIKAVSYTDADLQMPPKGRKLSGRQIADLTQWVNAGAPWPDAGAAAPRPAAVSHEISANDRNWWAFQPIRRPPVPKPKNDAENVGPIDSFIRAELEARGLEPNPPANRRELVRRAYFDLIGLPPTPEQVAAFEQDTSPDAWPRLIDHLLSLPQYGERWGRHWLDVVRFAQSNGYERDGEKPEAWRYRDYVVKSFNQDKPYDQFITEQLAGDELDRVTFDSLIATGFQRLGVWDDEPDDKRMAEFDELDDILSTTGTAFLGLTIGCARCHEHKFDPIPQSDYYSLLSFFRNLRLNEAAKYTLEAPNYVPLADPAAVAAWQTARDARLKPLQDQLAAVAEEKEKKPLMEHVEKIQGERPPFEFALAVRERGPTPPPTQILVRGNAGSPGAEVTPAFLSVLGQKAPDIPAAHADAVTSGRRRVLAQWMASPQNPLTARVMANRIWQHLFGRGIVRTTSDFGRVGAPPTHPALLDWLAAEFIGNGWSIKKLQRTIMLSRAYRMSSRAENARALQVDPGNDAFWRQNLRRLEAETLRDTFLAVSGRLNSRMGGRGFFPQLSGEVLAGQSRPGLDWEICSPAELSRRSLYAYVRRTMPVPMLDAFDYSNTTSPLSERPVTTVAPQALLLLNDEFMREQAAALAARLARVSRGDLDQMVKAGFRNAVGREPTSRELQFSRDFIARQESSFAALATRLTFRADVPTSLSVDYMSKLGARHFLAAPATGWSCHQGRWAGAYEGIRTMEPDRGPFALHTAAVFSNGTIEANVFLHTAAESAGVLFRASATNEEARGYEVALEPRAQRILLRRHAEELSTLAEAPARVVTGAGLRLRIDVHGSRIQVWFGDGEKPALDFRDPNPLLAPGCVGARAWGSGLSLDDVVLHPEGATAIAVRDPQLAPPSSRAREAFCLLLLNLNEVLFID